MSSHLNKLLLKQIKTGKPLDLISDLAKQMATRTSIVIKFDGKPMYTIDHKTLKKGGQRILSKSSNYLSAALGLMATGGNVVVNGFDWSNTLVAGTIVKIVVDTMKENTKSEKESCNVILIKGKKKEECDNENIYQFAGKITEAFQSQKFAENPETSIVVYKKNSYLAAAHGNRTT